MTKREEAGNRGRAEKEGDGTVYTSQRRSRGALAGKSPPLPIAITDKLCIIRIAINELMCHCVLTAIYHAVVV